MFSLGHQGLPRLPQSLEKPPSSIPQEGVRGHGEGGGEEVQGAPQSEEQSIPDICHESHEYTRVNFFWPV